jgi:hypothetical protein
MRLGGLDLRRSISQTVVATLVMAEAIVLLTILLRAAGADPRTVEGALVLSAAGGLGGLATYSLTTLLVGSEDFRILRRLRGA